MNILTFFENHPETLITILSGFLLPIILVWLNNKYNLKTKKEENKIDLNYRINSEQITYEKVIHSSLIKILFEIQKLYISLSCDPKKENDCILNATQEFHSSFAKYQSIISENQIYLESKVVNLLYKFYNTIGNILVELNQIRQTTEQEISRVCVYDQSQILADIIIDIQQIFIGKRTSLYDELKLIRSEMGEFRTCCGPPPDEKLRAKYNQVLKELTKLPNIESLQILEK